MQNNSSVLIDNNTHIHRTDEDSDNFCPTNFFPFDANEREEFPFDSKSLIHRDRFFSYFAKPVILALLGFGCGTIFFAAAFGYIGLTAFPPVLLVTLGTIGLLVGVAAAVVVITYIIFRLVRSRNCYKSIDYDPYVCVSKLSKSSTQNLHFPFGPPVSRENHHPDGHESDDNKQHHCHHHHHHDSDTSSQAPSVWQTLLAYVPFLHYHP